MNNKSQVSQVFVYLISTLIIIFVLYYGYTAVRGFSSRQEQIAYATFKASFEKAIDGISSDYGTVRIQEIDAPPQFNKVCIVDPRIIGTYSSDLNAVSPIIADSVSSGAKNNVFLMPNGNPFYLEKIEISEKFICSEIKYGKVKLRLEGTGKSARISLP